MNSLYNIREEHLQLISLIEENEGELTPELETALALTEMEFQQKAISYGYVIKKFDDNLSAIDAEIDRLSRLRDAASKKKELFRQRLSEAMQQFGYEKIETPLLKLSFRKSESVNIYNENDLPEQFIQRTILVTYPKTPIKEAIKAGADVPGAEIITKKNLQIK